jgi:hypothetical protein
MLTLNELSFAPGTAVGARLSIVYPNITHSRPLVVDKRRGGAVIEVTNSNGIFIVTAVSNGGANYVNGDTITILGSALGGINGANDLHLIVTNKTSAGALVLGELVVKPAAVTPTVVYAGIAHNNDTVVDSRGGGAVIEVTNTDGTYAVTGVANGGTASSGYSTGDTITILGTILGGTAPTNNLVLTVTDDGNTDGMLTLDELSFAPGTAVGASPSVVFSGITFNRPVEVTAPGVWKCESKEKRCYPVDALKCDTSGKSGDCLYDMKYNPTCDCGASKRTIEDAADMGCFAYHCTSFMIACRVSDRALTDSSKDELERALKEIKGDPGRNMTADCWKALDCNDFFCGPKPRRTKSIFSTSTTTTTTTQTTTTTTTTKYECNNAEQQCHNCVCTNKALLECPTNAQDRGNPNEWVDCVSDEEDRSSLRKFLAADAATNCTAKIAITDNNAEVDQARAKSGEYHRLEQIQYCQNDYETSGVKGGWVPPFGVSPGQSGPWDASATGEHDYNCAKAIANMDEGLSCMDFPSTMLRHCAKYCGCCKSVERAAACNLLIKNDADYGAAPDNYCLEGSNIVFETDVAFETPLAAATEFRSAVTDEQRWADMKNGSYESSLGEVTFDDDFSLDDETVELGNYGSGSGGFSYDDDWGAYYFDDDGWDDEWDNGDGAYDDDWDDELYDGDDDAYDDDWEYDYAFVCVNLFS